MDLYASKILREGYEETIKRVRMLAFGMSVYGTKEPSHVTGSK